MYPYSREGRGHNNYNSNAVSEQELYNAKEALASLKMKTNSQRVHRTNNIMPPYNGTNKYAPSYEIDSKLNGGISGKGINSNRNSGIDRGGFNGYNQQPRQPQKYQYNPQPQHSNLNPYAQGNIMPRTKLNTTNSTRPKMNINQNFDGGIEMEDNRPLDKGGDMNNYDVNNNEELSPCPDCGKMFLSGPLAKHVKICKKVFGKKRRAFDSKKMRILDSEQVSLMKQGELEEKKRKIQQAQKKKSNVPKWKKQSEELRRIAQVNKENAESKLKNELQS